MQHVFYDLLHHTAMQAGLAGGDHTMGENGTGHVFYIVWDSVIPSRNCGVCLGRTVECERTTRAHTQFDSVMGSSGAHQFNDVAFNAWLDTHAPDQFLQTL